MRNISEAVTIRLKELLDERGLSVYKLERRSAVSHDTLKSIMKGKTKGVNLKTLIALSDGLGITVSEFLNSELFSYDNLNTKAPKLRINVISGLRVICRSDEYKITSSIKIIAYSAARIARLLSLTPKSGGR